MKWMQQLMVGFTVVALIWPGVSFAQPAGKTAGGEFVRSMVTPLLNVIYFPVKFGVGVGGALLGGVSGALNGGDERAAEGIWRPTTGGTYFITPDVLDNDRPFLPFNYGKDAPPAPVPRTYGASVLPAAEGMPSLSQQP